MNAADIGHHECVDLLLKAGAAKDIRDNGGRTALMKTALEGHHECVDLLLKAGAAKDIRDNEGFTALALAAGIGHHANGHHDALTSCSKRGLQRRLKTGMAERP